MYNNTPLEESKRGNMILCYHGYCYCTANNLYNIGSASFPNNNGAQEIPEFLKLLGPYYPNASNVTFPEIDSEQVNISRGDNHSLSRPRQGEDLGNFFSRPVHLYDLTWNTSTTYTNLRPWRGWFDNKRVANRLVNYSGFKGNLHLKFTVIGNPFYFGRTQVSYFPLCGYQNSINDNDYSTDSFGRAIIRSQRMKFDIDPSVSSGAEMVLPFVWDQDFMRIDGNTQQNLYDFGTVDMDVISSLTNLSQVTGSEPPVVTIRVYAWMDNMETFGNTAFTPVITPQCDEGQKKDWEQEEANKGVISKTLTSISGVCDTLSEVPAIAPYAMPASMVTGLAAELAQKLGYSKPLDITTPERMIPRPFHGDTHVIGGDSPVKLTLDPYQNTTLDPVILGAEEDEMSFKYLCSKDSLFNRLSWVMSDPQEHLIASYPVTPRVVYQSGLENYATAVGGVSNLFQYWYGTLHYTFDIISTCFHRGRILVVYDPLGSKPSDNVEENVQYAAVVDISEARSFTVSISFNSTYGMLPVGGLDESNIGSASTTSLQPWHNGVISLYVANGLTIPNYIIGQSPDGVNIVSYVRGGDDLSFAFPRAINNTDNNNITYAQADMTALGDPQLMKCCDKDQMITTLDVSYKDGKDYGVVYKGEDIQSLRTLAKRYVHYYTSYSPASSNKQMVTFAHGPYPAFSGETIALGEPKLDNDTAYNYVGFTYISYIKGAYMTMRGSTRWKLLPMKQSAFAEANNHGYLSVLRTGTDGPGLLAKETTTYIASPSASKFIGNVLSGYMSGGALTTMNVNDTLDFEMPYQGVTKFRVGRSNDGATIALTPSQQRFNIVAPSTSFPEWFSLFVAAGEDFNAQHFVGWPPYQVISY